MRDFLARWYGEILAGLTFAAVGLGIANLVRSGSLSNDTFLRNKDLIDGGSKLLAAVALSGGGLLSYYRFFRGRTFKPRISISIHPTVHPAMEGHVLHSVHIEINNIGPVPIWRAQLKLTQTWYGPGEYFDRVVSQWWDPAAKKDGKQRLSIIDSGESAAFHTIDTIPAEVWAVTYTAVVEGDSGDVWATFATVTNAVSAAKGPQT